MRNRLLIPFAIIVALGALVVAGCGDDDETTTSGATGASGVAGAALTEDEFVTQANAICKAGGKEVDAQIEETFGGGEPTDAEVEQFASDILVPSIQGQIDAVRALVPPEELADDVTAFLDESERALGEIEEDPSLLRVSDEKGPFAESNRQAEALGLDECAG